MHLHSWTWIDSAQEWRCSCGEIVTLSEFRAEYGQSGNLDVDPDAALNKLVANRSGRRATIRAFR